MFKKHRTVYIINKVTEDKFQLCKVINEYNNEEEVKKDLVKLLTKKVSENELLEQFNSKEL